MTRGGRGHEHEEEAEAAVCLDRDSESEEVKRAAQARVFLTITEGTREK
jgi:hypothetical protein